MKPAFRIPSIGIATLLAAAALLVAAPSHAGYYLRLRVLVVVYPHTFADLATREETDLVDETVARTVEGVWRASRMRLHLAVDSVVIGRYLDEDLFWEVEPEHYWLSNAKAGGGDGVERDLEDFGYARDAYDVVIVFYAFENRAGHWSPYGGATFGVNQLLGKAAYIGIPLAWAPKTLQMTLDHEILHAFESIFEHSGHPDFPDVHNEPFFRSVFGDDASWSGWLLGEIPDRSYHEPTGTWGSVREFPDKDGDGLPDYSPAWDELAITEANFGTSRLLPDTDRDGVGDLEEAIRHGLPHPPETGPTH
jgi:hypothetical protein